jgi:hypothetical protein
MQPEEFFAGHPRAWAVFERVRSVLDGLGPVEVRTSRSQVAFRSRPRHLTVPAGCAWIGPWTSSGT